MAGKKIRCPNCQAVLAVPGNGSGDPVPRPAPPAKAPPASPRPAPAVRTQPRPVPGPAGEPPFDRPAPPRQTALRIVALVLGIVGALAVALMALGAYAVANNPIERAAAEHVRESIAGLEKNMPDAPELAQMRSDLSRFERTGLLGHVGLVACVLAIAGALLGFFHLGKVAAPLLILPAIGGAILNPRSLIFTTVLIATGIICLFIRSKPRAWEVHS
jgi:hypothetical protein